MKKSVALLLTFLCLGAVSAHAEETENKVTQYINDGYIEKEKTFSHDMENNNVTVAVVDKSIDLTDESDWMNMNPKQVFFYDTFLLDADKAIEVKFKLDASGVYKYFVFSKAEEVEEEKLIYISKDKNDELVSRIEKATTFDELEAIMENVNLNDLGVFGLDKSYGEIDINEFCKIMFSSLPEDKTTETVRKITEKSILSQLLNENKLKSFYDYEDLSVLNEDVFSFPADDEDLINIMQGKNIENTGEFDELLINGVALSLANGADADALYEFLKEYENSFSFKSTLTQEKCKAAIKEGNFSDTDDLISFVDNYKKNNGSGGGSNGGGGGKKPSGSRYDGMSIVSPSVETNKVSEIDVFDDIADVSWAKEAITNLFKANVINGKADRLFFPNDSITREEFTKILIAAFNMKLVDEEIPFTDVTESDWSYDYIKTAYLAGVVKGISEDTFGKKQNITRQDLAVMVYRVLKLADSVDSKDSSTDYFGDADEISEYAKEAVGGMYKLNIISGDDRGMFNPKNNASRAEAAKIVYNAMKIYESAK